MDATTLKYGVACVAVLAFTGWNRGVSLRAFQFAGLLAITYVLTNLLALNFYYPEALAPFPIIDATAGVIVAISTWKAPKIWEVLLSGTFLTLCARHAIFWWGQTHGEGYETVNPYIDNLSMIFSVQLALVCIPGGVRVVGKLHSVCASGLMRLLRRPVRSSVVRHKGSPQ